MAQLAKKHPKKHELFSKIEVEASLLPSNVLKDYLIVTDVKWRAF